MISITNNVNDATVITHAGVFHADDVFATVILSKVRENVVVARVQRVPDNLSADVVVYDIGGGKFDHHQRGGNGARPNGVPYASCGLLWKEFGPQDLCRYFGPRKGLPDDGPQADSGHRCQLTMGFGARSLRLSSK